MSVWCFAYPFVHGWSFPFSFYFWLLWPHGLLSLPGFSVHGILQQEYWSGLPFPSPGDLPNPGIEPLSPAFQNRKTQGEDRLAVFRNWGCWGAIGIPQWWVWGFYLRWWKVLKWIVVRDTQLCEWSENHEIVYCKKFYLVSFDCAGSLMLRTGFL